MVSERQLFAGVDIGATSVKAGIVTADGRIVAREQQALLPKRHEPADVVALTAEIVERALKTLELRVSDLKGVGVGCPGVLLPGGIIHAAANFPTWSAVPLQQLLAARFGVPVRLCNDADAAILAEQWVGTASGINNFLMLTLGTGVGFGIIGEGKLVRGGSNVIEGGHIIVERNGRLCGCTQRGCLEAYSSASALVQVVQEHLNAGADTTLASYSQADINVKLIFEHATKGDPMCIRLIAEAADYLGFACVSFCRILDPEMIVLSGGIAEAGETFIQQVRAAYLKYTWTKFPNPVRIEKASAGYDSGILGAAATCRDV